MLQHVASNHVQPDPKNKLFETDKKKEYEEQVFSNLNVAILSTENNSLNAASDSNYGEIAHLDIDLLKSETNIPNKVDLND